jgi:bifunctional non-homologous end joining protein LigD
MGLKGKKITNFIRPMLATPVDRPFNSKDWLFELKLDGYRAIADTSKKKILLYSRNGFSLASKFPTIIAALKKIGVGAVLDGEIVLLDEKNRPDFQKLVAYKRSSDEHLVYFVFDILSCRLKDLTGLPLIERKKILKKIIRKSGPIRFCTHIEEHGQDLFRTARADELEGIVGKKKDSQYVPGVRSRDWLKIRNRKTQEAIIAGFTVPSAARKHFGGIILGQYRNSKLVYIGTAVTGFSEQAINELLPLFKKLKTKNSPFSVPIKTNRVVTWLKPEIVCQVGYSELSREGLLKQIVFKGLRHEKKAEMIKQETERSLPIEMVIKNQVKNK